MNEENPLGGQVELVDIQVEKDLVEEEQFKEDERSFGEDPNIIPLEEIRFTGLENFWK